MNIFVWEMNNRIAENTSDSKCYIIQISVAGFTKSTNLGKS